MSRNFRKSMQTACRTYVCKESYTHSCLGRKLLGSDYELESRATCSNGTIHTKISLRTRSSSSDDWQLAGCSRVVYRKCCLCDDDDAERVDTLAWGTVFGLGADTDEPWDKRKISWYRGNISIIVYITCFWILQSGWSCRYGGMNCGWSWLIAGSIRAKLFSDGNDHWMIVVVVERCVESQNDPWKRGCSRHTMSEHTQDQLSIRGRIFYSWYMHRRGIPKLFLGRERQSLWRTMHLDVKDNELHYWLTSRLIKCRMWTSLPKKLVHFSTLRDGNMLSMSIV